jgi:phytoene synthase
MNDQTSAGEIARHSGSNFYFSFFALPRPKREALISLYAFCRQVDDAVDAPGVNNPEEEVARWRREIENTFAGNPSLPLTRSLRDSIEKFNLSRAYFDGILDGVAMDLQANRYPSFDALSRYCYHVAGEVGLLCVEIFGYRSERLKTYAVQLGLAFQLTNILRDVRTDAERGRIYIPQEDLQKFGVAEDWILSQGVILAKAGIQEATKKVSGSPLTTCGDDGSPMDNFRRLMAFEADRAKTCYNEAKRLPTKAELPDLRAAEIMAAVYREVLNRIEKRNYNVFGERIRVPGPVKIRLALKAWWDCR